MAWPSWNGMGEVRAQPVQCNGRKAKQVSCLDSSRCAHQPCSPELVLHTFQVYTIVYAPSPPLALKLSRCGIVLPCKHNLEGDSTARSLVRQRNSVACLPCLFELPVTSVISVPSEFS